jgi:hypothetical protein
VKAFQLCLRYSFQAALFGLLLAGCVNNFERFYTGEAISPNLALLPYSGTTKVYSSGNLQEDGLRLVQDGFVLLGVASFQTGGRVTLDQIRDQAKQVGADTVLWSDKYLGSQQAIVPLPQYNPGTTSTTNTYGTLNTAYGSANYNASSTTTTPGTFSTEMVPITIQRYEYSATFWRKAQSFVFGARGINLPDELRQRLQRNGGVLVKVVVVDSPAFMANILPGDVIIRINDWDIYSAEQYTHVISMERGKASVVTIIRNGELKSIPVTLNP